ncbi:hypothetical protein AAAC51_22000 [Priestia megaterium]
MEQKAEGLTDFVPLLTQFVGMLNYKLTPRESRIASLSTFLSRCDE